MFLVGDQARSLLWGYESCRIYSVEKIVKAAVDGRKGGGHWTTKIEPTKAIEKVSSWCWSGSKPQNISHSSGRWNGWISYGFYWIAQAEQIDQG